MWHFTFKEINRHYLWLCEAPVLVVILHVTSEVLVLLIPQPEECTFRGKMPISVLARDFAGSGGGGGEGFNF